MILSEKSATFRDHALAPLPQPRAPWNGKGCGRKAGEDLAPATLKGRVLTGRAGADPGPFALSAHRRRLGWDLKRHADLSCYANTSLVIGRRCTHPPTAKSWG